MNVALWIVAGVLAALFLASGVVKVARSRAQLASAGLAWVDDVGPGAVKTIGGLEILAAAGLVLPGALGIAPVLVPLAAVGLALLMIGALVLHARRHEVQGIAVTVVLLALAVLVAWGRFT
ncbi:MAG TPA: DoxX family protein [Pseudonocardiaceae bacterium]|nr:DoxX family protein [Pseudonocardiaceae bacterium]